MFPRWRMSAAGTELDVGGVDAQELLTEWSGSFGRLGRSRSWLVDSLRERASNQPIPGTEARGTARRHPRADARGAGESRLHSQRFPDARPSPRRVPRVFRLPRCADAARFRLEQGRARDDRRCHIRRQRLPVLHRRARRDPSHLCQESAARRPGRGQLSQGGHQRPAEGDARRSRSKSRCGRSSWSMPTTKRCGPTASPTRTSGTSARSRLFLRCPTGWPT